MRATLWILLVPLVAASCTTANGPAFRAETARSAFSGSWSDTTLTRPGNRNELEVTTMATDFSMGVFVNPEIEGGVKVGFFDQDAGKSRLRSWDASAYGRYYFQSTGTLRPWGEAQLGYAQGRDQGVSDTAVFWGVGAGMTQFLTDSTAVELSLDYDQRSFAFRGGDTDIATTALTIAYSIFF